MTALLLGLMLLAPAPLLQAAVTWSEATDEAGVDFRTAGEIHQVAGTEWPAFPEIMGSGACWFDYDRDGFDDLYLVNQVYNHLNPAWDADWVADADPHNQLYRNEGDGSFADVSATAGVDSRAWGLGCSAADYDGDGWLDLFVANFGDNELFRNLGDGTFANVTGEAGVAMPQACGEFVCMSTSSAWADYDADGDLDLFVGNYVDTHLEDPGRGPNFHNAQPNWLFRNDGDGTFTEVAQSAGVRGQTTDADGSKSLGVVWFDADLDGDLDLYVANDMTPNDYYVNRGDGTFDDRSAVSGLEDTRAGMGVASGDYDRDGLPDLYFTHYDHQDNGFYRNLGDGTFEDRSGEDDLDTAWPYVGWGTAFVDWDRDMDLDLIAVNGHTENAAAHAFTLEPWYNEPTLVYRQDPNLAAGAQAGDANWTDVSDTSGSAITKRSVARGAAFADYDLDGDVDLVLVPNANQTARLLRAEGVTANWLLLTLAQPGGNPDAVGARVQVTTADGTVQVREVQTGTSYLSQNSMLLDFGLGSHSKAEEVTVHWPSGGGTTTLTDLPAGHLLRIDQATGAVLNDTLAPRTRAEVDAPGGPLWFRGAADVRLVTQDRGVGWASGAAGSEYHLGDGAWAANTGQTFHVEGEGVHTFWVRSHDHAGNREIARAEEVRLDLTPPMGSHSVEGVPGSHGWFVSDAEVTLRGEDALSGVAEVRHRVGDGPWTETTGPIGFTTDGVHVVTYEVEDRAGNVAGPYQVTVAIDRGAPEVAYVTPREGVVYLGPREMAEPGKGPAVLAATPGLVDVGGTTFPVRVAASDDVSGVSHVAFQVNGRYFLLDRTGPEWGFDWDLRDTPPGWYELTAVASDRAGNTRSDVVVTVVVSAAPEALDDTLDQGPVLPRWLT